MPLQALPLGEKPTVFPELISKHIQFILNILDYRKLEVTFEQTINMRYLLLFLFILGVSQSYGQAENEQYIKDYIVKLENSKDHLISVINAMPADKMDYKPVEDGQTFRALTIHIVSNIAWLSTDYFEGEGFESDYKTRDLSKEELVELVEYAFDFSISTIQAYDVEKLDEEQKFFAGPMTGYQLLRLINDHCSHHRGQLTLYLKLNDIAVPRYVGW